MEIHIIEVTVFNKSSKIVKLNASAIFLQEPPLQARYILSTHPCDFLWHC